MLFAIKEAKKAYDLGEVPVGCVIVDRVEKKIVAKSHNIMQKSQNPNFHAEIVAINKACKKLKTKNLSNCDIYVTLEPCTMCASAISHARINSLYYGACDKKHGAVENGVRFYSSKACFHKPNIYSGIGSKQSSEMLKDFFIKIRSLN